ncbi:hypothetical protein ILYODFUR_036393 [Ilyodon furcidens]|uniref:Secreted protein n=1 Tax=Ilyodon furcidens TaxID=33524 RepID=A0ABV0TPT4_9TELE
MGVVLRWVRLWVVVLPLQSDGCGFCVVFLFCGPSGLYFESWPTGNGLEREGNTCSKGQQVTRDGYSPYMGCALYPWATAAPGFSVVLPGGHMIHVLNQSACQPVSEQEVLYY